MGMFDRVWAACPHCETRLELQSKGGRCSLYDYTLYDAPANVLGYMEGDEVTCGTCRRTWRVQVAAQARLIPRVDVPDDDEHAR
jgi:hypothetical protein